MKYCPSCLKCFEETLGLCADDGSALVEAPPRAPVVAGKYRIERLISRGPNVVYEGTQVKTERPVAIKLILAGAGASEYVRQKALAVSCVSTRVDHQHVVKTYDYGQLPDGIAYVVTELVDGRTLREHLDGRGRLAAAEAARIARQVADGLAAAHACGVVHGGLNTSNVILARDYHGRPDAKVINFGLSACWVASPGGAGAAVPHEARRYLSPEQLRGRAADARSDVYSLGVVFHEMLTGRASCARRADSDTELRGGESGAHGEACCEQVPEPVLALVTEALHEKPAARLQSAAEFARRLRLIECPETSAPPGGSELAPSASDHKAYSEQTDLPLSPGRAASVPPTPAVRTPVRKVGFLDDYADAAHVGRASPPAGRPSLAEDDPTPLFEAGVAAASGRRPRPSRDESRVHAERPRTPTRPAAPSPGAPQAHAHYSLAVAVPTLLVLALGVFGWLTSRTTRPASTNKAATEVPNSGARLAESKPPESVVAEGAIDGEAAVPSADADAQGVGNDDELHRPGVEARRRVGPRATEDGVITSQKIPDEEAPTNAAVRPRRATPSSVSAGRGRAGEEGCAITTSKGTLTLRSNGGSGEVAVGLRNGPADPAAVTAATSDWSDIVVLAASRRADGVGDSVYRIVSVSRRAGTYHVTFNSPCGARRVTIKVE